MLITKKNLEIIANTVSRHTGVRLVGYDGSWAADIRKKIIYYPKDTMFTTAHVGVVLHESAHLRYSFSDEQFTKDFFRILKPLNKDRKQLMWLFNALEDIRINSLLFKDYAGAHDYVYENDINAFARNLQVLETNYIYEPHKVDEYIEKGKTHQHNTLIIVKDYLDDMLVNQFVNFYMHPDALGAVETNLSIAKQVTEVNDPEKLLDVYKRLLPEYLPLCDDIDKKKEEEKEKSDKEKMKELKKLIDELLKAMKASMKRIKEGKSHGTNAAHREQEIKKLEEAEKKGEGEGEGEGGKGEGEPKKKPDDAEGDKDGDGDGMVEIGASAIGGGVEEKKIDSQEALEEMKKTRKGGGVGATNQIFDTKQEAFYTVEELSDSVNKNLAKVRKAISILKDISTERFEGNYKTGKLKTKKLYKLLSGRDNIFERRIATDMTEKDMAIAVVVDESGSMQGSNKEIHACNSTALIAKALEIAGRPNAVYGFNARMTTIKDWNKKVKLRDMLAIVNEAHGGYCGDNNDGYAIKYVAEILKKRSELNKVMIVLSDGQPAPGYDYEQYDLKDEVRKAEKSGIKIYAIGIRSSAVASYYKTYAVVQNAEELGHELIKIIKANTGKRIR